MVTIRFVVAILLLCIASLTARATEPVAPVQRFVDEGRGQRLRLDVFEPPAPAKGKVPRAAIVLFHGGGWSVGDASWIYPTARVLAGQGMVAIAVDYRLSDQKTVTPFDSVADARAAIRWVRANAGALGIDPEKVAAGGISAGGHLAAATAVFDEPGGAPQSARPDLLVLWSSAVAVSEDGWFTRLSGGPAQAAALSPDRYIRAGLPAAILLQGTEDSVTPAAGAKRFCKRMQQAGNTCELVLYPGVGHLFTHNLQQQENPDYKAIDREIDDDADRKAIAFLRKHGFIAPVHSP